MCGRRPHGLSPGGLPGSIIAIADDPDFATELYAHGASLVLRADATIGCPATQGEVMNTIDQSCAACVARILAVYICLHLPLIVLLDWWIDGGLARCRSWPWC